MPSALKNLRYILLALFAASSLAAFGYEWWFVWPAQKCEARQNWWDPRDHECLTPMPIWRITGRLPTTVVTGATAAKKP